MSALSTDRAFPNWFTGGYAERIFSEQLGGMAGTAGLRFLQIGAYAGDATRWLMEHVLTAPDSLLVDVDTWEGSPETFMTGVDFGSVQAYYEEWKPERVHALQMTSGEYFAETWDADEEDRFHFVYVDGSHEARHVLDDAIGAFRMTKVGGLLAFDDYMWSDPARPEWDRPRTAIDAFDAVYRDRVEMVVDGLQRWYRKIRD